MKKYIGILLGLSMSVNISFGYYELLVDRLDGKNINIIKVDLRDGEHFVVTSVALTGGDTLENLTKKRPNAVASANAGFFCPDDYSYCDETHTITERVYNGNGKAYSSYRPNTGIRGLFSISRAGEPFLVQNNMDMHGLNKNLNDLWINEVYFGVSNWPVLLMEGEDVIRGAEHVLDGKLRSRRLQSFICHTEDEKEIYFGHVHNTTIYEMPEFLTKHFNCFNAINLDAGASTAMTFDNKVLKRGGRRRVMDAFVVVPRDSYELITNIDLPDAQPINLPQPYELTADDQKIVDNVLQEIDDEMSRRPKFRQDLIYPKIIHTLYKGFEHPKAKTDPRVKAVLKEIIVALMTVDTL